MNLEMDPLADDEEELKKAPSRESIKSFWIGCAGLSVLAILSSIGAIVIGGFDAWLISLSGIPHGPNSWVASYGVQVVIGTSLIPGIVIGAVVPVLYWRGGLMQRFAISVVLAVTTMNLTMNANMWSGNLKISIRQVVAILLCWIVMPALFLWTPVRTRNLRLIVASGLMLMSLCLSILHMFAAPPNVNFLYWEALFGAAFCYALLRRNWGRVAVFESDASMEQIERTSSGTLLELMAVCGLACSATMYWSTSLDYGVAINLLQAFVLGIGCVLICMASNRMALRPGITQIWKRFAIGPILFLLFSANSCVYFAVNERWGWSKLQWEAIMVILISSLIASVAFGVYLVGVGRWLKWCVWRIDDQR